MLGLLCIVGFPVQLIREVFSRLHFRRRRRTLSRRFEALGYVLPHFDELTHVVLTFCIKPGCFARRPLCHKVNLPSSVRFASNRVV